MDTEIRYLELVRSDLQDAARREWQRRRERVNARNDRLRLARPVVAVAAAIVVLAGLVGVFATSGGFSADGGDGGGSDEVAGPTGGAATGATGATGGNDGELGGFHSTPAPQASPAPDDAQVGVDTPTGAISRVIRTAQLELEIPRGSFDERFGDAADVASDLGGYVQDSTTRERSGELTMRVPAATFGDALGDLRELGDVQVQRIQGQDVTAEYVDLRARVRIARARREVLLRLMDQANSIEQTIRVQNALDDTQLRIEELQGQLNLLDDRTSLATIRLELREEGVEPVEDVEAASIPNAFERSVAGFVGVIAAIVIGLGYLIPPILIGLVAWFVSARVRRRRPA